MAVFPTRSASLRRLAAATLATALAQHAGAAQVVIREFMASNDRTITNSLGDRADWIELQNISASAVDLSGWHLTDASNHVARWTFPAGTPLAPGAFRLVWASGLGVATNGELHASFKLDADGEYLALLRPDGTTEHAYAPVYPPQRKDVSYGLASLGTLGTNVVLVDSISPCRALVPADGALGLAWTARTFDDGAWTNGLTGVGYDRSASPVDYRDFIELDLGSNLYNRATSAYLRIPFAVDDPSFLRRLVLRMRYDDGFVAYLNGTEVARANAPATPAWDSAATATHADAEAVLFRDFVLSNAPASVLVAGTNLLAVHGLNASKTSTDMLAQAQLAADTVDPVDISLQRYFAIPTPGATNNGAFANFVADTKFSVDRGFFTNAFSVAISCETAGAEIRTTTDGGTPTEMNGAVYAGPIGITNTTVLRAAAFRAGWQPSDVDTQTYIFPADVLRQPHRPAGWPTNWSGGHADYEMDPEIVDDPAYAGRIGPALAALPVISIVTDRIHLFGSSGIYDNPTREGVTWERPASFEIFHADGRNDVQVNCGLRIQGGASRTPANCPKHSFRVLFKDLYGPTKLRFALFPDSRVEEFDTLILRAGYNNTWLHWDSPQRSRSQYVTDQWMRDTHRAMGRPAAHGLFAHVFLNGLYWGVYNPSERPDASFAAAHLGGSKEDWDSTNSGEFIEGDPTAWTNLHALANAGVTSLAAYAAVQTLCDVTNLADYMILNQYGGNSDWDHHNWYAARRRSPDGRYIFLSWDAEKSLETTTANVLSKDNTNMPSRVFQRLMQNAEYRLLFADRIHRHLLQPGGALTPGPKTNRWEARHAEAGEAHIAESARWGDYRRDVHPYSNGPYALYDVDDEYATEHTRMLTVQFAQRGAQLLTQYRGRGWYPAIAAPSIAPHGGTFAGSIDVPLSATTTVYYTLNGADPRAYGTGTPAGTPYAGPVALDRSTRLRARALGGTDWSAMAEAVFLDIRPSPLRISELMVAPRADGGGTNDPSDFEFVEIVNTGDRTVGLAGVRLTKGVRFDFGDGAIDTLAPGARAVVIRNATAFEARHGPGLPVAGVFEGGLDDTGERVTLDVEGVGEVASFEYGSGAGWPAAAGGPGHSLVPRLFGSQADGALDYGGNWTAGAVLDGTPGAAEPSGAPPVLLNEVTAHTDFSSPAYPGYDSNDWIELFNPSTSAWPLAGCWLSDDPADLRKWAVPTGAVIAARGLLSFDEISGFHAPLTNGFGLDKAGEWAVLSWFPGGGNDRVLDAVRFGGQDNGVSLGRYPDGGAWQRCEPTRNATNRPAAAGVVLDEIMFHPPDDPPGTDNTADEYIVLRNAGATPVPMWVDANGGLLGTWRLRGQIDFDLPTNTTLAAGARLIAVPFAPTDPVALARFTARHGSATNGAALTGPWSGTLSDRGGRVRLERPQEPDLPGEPVIWTVVDEVIYFDRGPWFRAADGAGHALHRIAPALAGAEPSNWAAGDPSPFGGAVASGDLDLSLDPGEAGLRLRWHALADLPYVVEGASSLVLGDWTPEAEVSTNAAGEIQWSPAPASHRTYRLRRER
jgi:hypothetical protein